MHIGSRLELFVDDCLIDKLDNARLTMHAPQLAPEPSPTGYYMTILKDGSLFRAYYRQIAGGYTGDRADGHRGEITCYAESRDGAHWTYPQLGLFDVAGPNGNNVILADAAPLSHNFSPFVDVRPGVPESERYKALAGIHSGGQGGLVAFVSGDGIHWRKIREEPVITHTDFAFDSQNVAFWSEVEGCYVCYFRTWETPHGHLRTISRTTSGDFIHWTEAVPTNPNVAGEHLYTSNTHPYFRAPHLYIALPTRFLPERGNSTDIMLMSARADTTARPSTHYARTFMEAFIRPGPDPARWGNRANYAALNVVPTGPGEMSIYHAPGGRRYTLRTDSFASVNAGYARGEMRTRPLTFSGETLVLNYATSAAGSVRVEMQSPDGHAIPGYSLAECQTLAGDEIEGVVRWAQGTDVSRLAGQPVRLRFAMQDADIFSMQVRNRDR